MYIYVITVMKGTVPINGAGADAAARQLDEKNKQVTLQ